MIAYCKDKRRSIQNVSDSIKLIRQISNNKTIPLLAHVCDTPLPDSATRKYIIEQIPAVYTAIALVVKPGFGALIMGIMFKYQTPPVPMKLFSEEKKALEWLRDFIPE